MDMINKIRTDLKEEDEDRQDIERDRTHLQRSALKSKQLLSNSNCPGCIRQRELDQNPHATQTSVGREVHTCIVRLLDKPNNDAAAVSAVSRGMSQRSALRTKSKQDQISANKNVAPTSKKDVNYFRKVSKYDIDRIQVDWRELMRER